MKEGTFLGFDFGTKYLGVAVGQTITQTATPLLTLKIPQGGEKATFEALSKVISEWQPKGFVVGLALQPDNTHSLTSLAAQKWGEALSAHFQLPVYFIEERLTSCAARERLRETPLPPRSSTRVIDAIAAAIILESWFTYQKELTCAK